jgi:hypothetical protein
MQRGWELAFAFDLDRTSQKVWAFRHQFPQPRDLAAFLIVEHGWRRVRQLALIDAEGEQVFPAQTRERFFRRKVSQELLIVGDGVLRPVLFSAHFGQAEECGGGQTALFRVSFQQGFVSCRSLREILRGFLRKKGVLQQLLQIRGSGLRSVRLGASRRHGSQ